jgi:small subunit ribosomal protein S1
VKDAAKMNGEQAVPSDETLSSEPQSSPEAIAPAAETAPVVEAAAPAAPALEASPGPESSAPAEGEPVAAAPAEDEEAPKRKVQLNPTQENAPRPVAMFAGTTPAAPPPADAAGAAISDAADAMSSMPMSATVASGPVALPEEKVELEASLEAELEAAMAGELSAPVPVVPEPGTAGDRDAVPLPQSEDQLEPGTRLKAKVQSVTAEDVFCEVGFRVPGVLPLRQFPSGKHPSVGEEFLVHVEKFDPENGVILVNLPKTTRRPKGNWEDLAVGQIVECLANRTNKGGL